jgi:large subunit ribosomal protein L10
MGASPPDEVVREGCGLLVPPDVERTRKENEMTTKVRPEKTAVIDEVKGQVNETTTAVVTEYRGLTVAEISQLRKDLRKADANYHVFKNTLVKRAIAGTDAEPMTEFLEGPTAIAWVKGDVSAVAKILRDFAKAVPTLIVKGGVLDGRALSLKDITALADLPSRDVLLSQFAGALASPMRTLASLMKAVPQNFAYGLSALVDAKGGPQAAPVAATTEEVEVAAVADAPATEDAEAPVADASVEETEAAAEDSAAESDAPAAE